MVYHHLHDNKDKLWKTFLHTQNNLRNENGKA